MAMVSGVISKRPNWQVMILLTLAFWLSGSLILDTLIMPILYTSGMMAAPDFAAAGYSIFWVFNRIELLCAAVVLTGALILQYNQNDGGKFGGTSITLSSLLLVVALIYTYGLSPQMSALGLQLDLFNSVQETPVLMNSLHVGYWVLEAIKLIAGGILLKLCYDFRLEFHRHL
ncbi:DUF4149 domain-containing protein [Kovacikia minuta CCNUW1]|uniref:DUF4149 domain-containing protein n=1 Tax=Kovacikia minuta TaxID=2931930 RepID=UPI001CC9208E|nr:DUF4149 domain-containing protein [Kovacikia minuta]UBF24906.1 DUF4149 domain-containing protein [Kovacikia minuta CCNUW1]